MNQAITPSVQAARPQGLSAGLLSLGLLPGLLGLVSPTHSVASEAQPLEMAVHLGLVNRYSFDCAAAQACERNGKTSGKLALGFALQGQSLEAMAFRIGSGQGSFKREGQNQQGQVTQTGAAAYWVLPYQASALSLKAKLGAGAVQSRVRFDAGPQQSRWTAQALIGLGASYALSQELNARIEWDSIPGNYGEGRSRVGMVSAGLGYRF